MGEQCRAYLQGRLRHPSTLTLEMPRNRRQGVGVILTDFMALIGVGIEPMLR